MQLSALMKQGKMQLLGLGHTRICRVSDSRKIVFLSRVSTLTRDIDIASLSVRLSVCLSVRDVRY